MSAVRIRPHSQNRKTINNLTMEYYNNILSFEAGWLIESDIVTKYNYDALVRRNQFNIVRRASRNTPALIAYDSMPERIKKAIKSLDFGETWSILTDMDNYWHGMYLLGLGDSIMVCGRAYNGDTTIIFFDKNGNTLLNPIRYSTGGDSAYSQICTFENYVYIIYYRQLNAVSWSVCTRKVERNKVLGLSY